MLEVDWNEVKKAAPLLGTLLLLPSLFILASLICLTVNKFVLFSPSIHLTLAKLSLAGSILGLILVVAKSWRNFAGKLGEGIGIGMIVSAIAFIVSNPELHLISGGLFFVGMGFLALSFASKEYVLDDIQFSKMVQKITRKKTTRKKGMNILEPMSNAVTWATLKFLEGLGIAALGVAFLLEPLGDVPVSAITKLKLIAIGFGALFVVGLVEVTKTVEIKHMRWWQVLGLLAIAVAILLSVIQVLNSL